jgi:hypothetical protein
MTDTYSLEIVPLELTDTGLRLRTQMPLAQAYDVVLRRETEAGSEFVSRSPADSFDEAEGLARDLIVDLEGKVSVIGDIEIPSEVVSPVAPGEEVGFTF